MTREHEMPDHAPVQRLFDLSDLTEAGTDVVVDLGAEDRARLADWLGIEAVGRFHAEIGLSRKGANRYRYEAVLKADLVQACVVSLEPVPSHHDLHFTRDLKVAPRQRRRPAEELETGGVLTLAAGEDEVPEELDSPHYDLAIPLLEELVLAIDPYPRAEGVAFELPQEHRAEKENPFAALKQLKREG